MVILTAKSMDKASRGKYRVIVTFDESTLKKTYEVYNKNKRIKKIESIMRSLNNMERDIKHYKDLGYK